MITRFEQFNKVSEGFVDWLTGKDEAPDKQDRTDKTVLDKNLEEFYKTLEEFVDSDKSIEVQSSGSYTYSKLVEDIQLALVFLGYKLPTYGIDGYFGPETAAAIQKFNSKTQLDQLSEKRFLSFKQFINEAENGMLPDSELISLPNSPNLKLNKVAYDAFIKLQTAAKSDGVNIVVSDAYRDYDSQVNAAAKKGLYSQGGLAATPGKSNHGLGSAIDIKQDPAAIEWMKQNASKYGFTTIPREPWHWEHKDSIKSMDSVTSRTTFNKTLIDADLVNRIIDELKQNNFSQEDISKLSTTVSNILLNSTNDDDFYNAILQGLNVNITPEKIKFLKAWRQAEGGTATNNPFNTTKDLPGDTDTHYNSKGVRNYPTRQSGLDATLSTLKLPYYTDLVNLLANDDITAIELAKSPALTKWRTGPMVQKVLAGGRINPPRIA